MSVEGGLTAECQDLLLQCTALQCTVYCTAQCGSSIPSLMEIFLLMDPVLLPVVEMTGSVSVSMYSVSDSHT